MLHQRVSALDLVRVRFVGRQSRWVPVWCSLSSYGPITNLANRERRRTRLDMGDMNTAETMINNRGGGRQGRSRSADVGF